MLSQSVTSASSTASAAVRKRGERIQANTTVLSAGMMLSFCALVAVLLRFFLSEQSLDARASNTDKTFISAAASRTMMYNYSGK